MIYLSPLVKELIRKVNLSTCMEEVSSLVRVAHIITVSV